MTGRRFPKVADSTEDRRRHIIHTATRLIAQRGLEGVSIRVVAEAAGCSRGLVEHYFRNKAELISAANQQVNETYLERIADKVGELQGMAALEAQLHNLLPYTEDVLDEWRVRTVFFRRSGLDPQTATHTNESFRHVYEEILAAMRQARAGGEIDASVPVQEASELILFVVIGIATACLLDETLRQRRPLDRRVAMMLGMLRSGSLAALQVGDARVEY